MKTSAKVSIEISKAKDKLRLKCAKTGLYENFGQREVMKLRDKYPTYDDYGSYTERDLISNLINDFSNWASNYTGR